MNNSSTTAATYSNAIKRRHGRRATDKSARTWEMFDGRLSTSAQAQSAAMRASVRLCVALAMSSITFPNE